MLGLPLAACLVMLSILGCIGVHILKREIVFIDIAFAQIVAVGAIWAHVHAHVAEGSTMHHAVTFGSALVAAAFYSLSRWRITQIPLEAVIGVSYAVGAAAALFLIGTATGGHVHVQHMLSGNILWVQWADLAFSTAVFVAAGLLLFLLRQPIGAISDDYEAARRRGMKVVWWDFIFYVLVGVVITRAVCVCGVVLLFAFLIVPATCSALFSPRWGPRLRITWSVGALASVLGLLFASRLDFSLGPSIALFLGVCLLLAVVLRTCRPRVSVPVLVLSAGVYVALLAAHPSSLEALRSAQEPAAQSSREADTQAPPPSVPESEVRSGLEEAGTPAEFEALFGRNDDPALRSDIVCRALAVDAAAGAALALRFLRTDPPFFFRQSVVDELGRVTQEEFAYDPTKPFSDPKNRLAILRVRERYGVKD